MRVAVTGAHGFVGRQICKALKREDHEVIAIVRDAGETNHIDRLLLSQDIFGESVDFWSRNLRDVDTLVHSAWYAEPGKYLNSTRNLHCLKGTLLLAEGAANAGVAHIVGIGTCLEYATSNAALAVSSPLDPATPYAASKAAAYLALSRTLPEFGTRFSWCRLFYLFGEQEDPRRLVPYVQRQLETNQPVALTSGNQIRDYLDVSIAGQQIANVATMAGSGTFNICSGVPVSIRDFVLKLADSPEKKSLLEFGAIADRANEPQFVVGVPSFG